MGIFENNVYNCMPLRINGFEDRTNFIGVVLRTTRLATSKGTSEEERKKHTSGAAKETPEKTRKKRHRRSTSESEKGAPRRRRERKTSLASFP